MKKILYTFLLCILALMPCAIYAQAVKVSGEVTAPLTIDKTELQKFKQVTVVYKDKEGKDHSYLGVAVADILQKAGVTLGPALRGANLTKYLMVEASDGYKAIFTLAELDKEFNDRAIILTDNVDGKPLLPTEGPFRIVVADEKKAARSVRQVVSLKVAFAK